MIQSFSSYLILKLFFYNLNENTSCNPYILNADAKICFFILYKLSKHGFKLKTFFNGEVGFKVDNLQVVYFMNLYNYKIYEYDYILLIIARGKLFINGFTLLPLFRHFVILFVSYILYNLRLAFSDISVQNSTHMMALITS